MNKPLGLFIACLIAPLVLFPIAYAAAGPIAGGLAIIATLGILQYPLFRALTNHQRRAALTGRPMPQSKRDR